MLLYFWPWRLSNLSSIRRGNNHFISFLFTSTPFKISTDFTTSLQDTVLPSFFSIHNNQIIILVNLPLWFMLFFFKNWLFSIKLASYCSNGCFVYRGQSLYILFQFSLLYLPHFLDVFLLLWCSTVHNATLLATVKIKWF